MSLIDDSAMPIASSANRSRHLSRQHSFCFRSL